MIHAYKLLGYNIILDVPSGSIHSVDEAAYDAITLLDGGHSRQEAAQRVAQKYAQLPPSEIDELFSDIAGLERSGKLFSADVYENAAIASAQSERDPGPSAARGAGAPQPPLKAPLPPLKALCLNVSHVCNMTCAYCFAGQGSYSGGGGLMSPETGKRAIDFLIENSGGRRNLDIDFFGGEPLLNFVAVKEIVEYARSVEHSMGGGADGGKIFRFTLTTNGLLIDDDFIDYANREMDNVVLSLDGRPEVHDAMRKLSGGRGSYDMVLPKIRRFVEARGNKEYYIRGTFTRNNTDFVKDILHIAGLGFDMLSMEPVVARDGDAHMLTPDDLPELCRQYEELAAEMRRRAAAGNGFTFYHYKLDLAGGPCVHKRIAGCGVGRDYMAVTPRGELYPCHQFVGDGRFLLGDIRSGVTNTALCREFAAHNIYTRAQCKSCWARMYCSGGCAANAYHATGDIGGVYELGCELFRKRMECAVMLKASTYQKAYFTAAPLCRV